MDNINRISFPGLGIDGFNLDPVAFRIPLPWSDERHPIMWYGLIITFAMIIGFMIALRKSKHEGIKSDNMFDLAIYLIVFCILGARLYYVLFYPGEYNSFIDVISIWNGGLAIYGGVLAGILTIVVFTKLKKISTAKLLDAAAPGLIIGQAIGRWGNFCNAEAFGGETTLPWRMGISRGVKIGDDLLFGTPSYVHPTFLYESLWNIIGFALIMIFYKKKKFNGQMALFYGIWYGFGRFFIEGMRTDSLYIPGTTLRVSQVVAAVCVIGGIVAMIVCGKIAKDRRMDAEEYEEVYANKGKLLGFDDEAEYDVKVDGEEKTEEFETSEEPAQSDESQAPEENTETEESGEPEEKE